MKYKFFAIVLLMTVSFGHSFAQQSGTFKDSRDGKVYKYVKIGTQTWMAENMAYKTSDKCWAYEGDQKNISTYGYLYDWETAKKICPAGWHLPNETEFRKLIDYSGGEDSAGCKLKEAGNEHWKSNQNELFVSKAKITNSTGFTALPGGFRYELEIFRDIGNNGWWWIGEQGSTTDEGKIMLLGFNSRQANIYSQKVEFGLSVRCLRDK